MNSLTQINYQSILKNLCFLYNVKVIRKIICFGLEILITDRVELKRTADMNFLRVDLDENLTWKDPVSIIENKI